MHVPTKVLEGQWGVTAVTCREQRGADRGHVNTEPAEHNIVWTVDCMVGQCAWECRDLQNPEQAVDM